MLHIEPAQGPAAHVSAGPAATKHDLSTEHAARCGTLENNAIPYLTRAGAQATTPAAACAAAHPTPNGLPCRHTRSWVPHSRHPHAVTVQTGQSRWSCPRSCWRWRLPQSQLPWRPCATLAPAAHMSFDGSEHGGMCISCRVLAC